MISRLSFWWIHLLKNFGMCLGSPARFATVLGYGHWCWLDGTISMGRFSAARSAERWCHCASRTRKFPGDSFISFATLNGNGRSEIVLPIQLFVLTILLRLLVQAIEFVMYSFRVRKFLVILDYIYLIRNRFLSTRNGLHHLNNLNNSD